MAPRFPGLDHLRALAIILVFLFHYRLFPHPGWIDTIGSFGWTGVDLFFVLSGYLISTQIFKGIANGTFSLKDFYLKRSFRILPAFGTVLALYELVPVFREWESLPPLWKLLTFTQNFGLDLREHRTFSHAWSLCIEEQFYLLLPFTLIALYYFKAGRRSALLVVALAIAGLILRLATWKYLLAPNIDSDSFGILWYKWMYYPTYTRLDGLLAGISIAAVTHYTKAPKRIIARYSLSILLAGAGFIAAAYFLCKDPVSFPASIHGFPLIAIGYGLIVSAASSAKGILNRFHSRVTYWIATLSYAVYLTHKAAIHIAHLLGSRFNVEDDSTVMFVLSMIISILFAALLHFCIERPCLKWKDNIIARRRESLASV